MARRRYSRPRIRGRDSSLAAAFVHAIIPRHVDIQAQKALYERYGINVDECVYCGGEARDTDHFFAIVEGGKPSGHFHTIDNLVPACGRCNESKSGAYWRDWITGPAPGSPATRKVPDLQERIERLSRFEQDVPRDPASALNKLRDVIGPERWDSYWNRLDEIKERMKDAQIEADAISRLVEAAFKRGGALNEG